MRARTAVPLYSLSLGTVLWLVFGAVAVVNYDTLYALLWGDQLLAGAAPELRAPAAPTPHPLLTAAATLGAPLLGSGSQAALAAIAYLGYVCTAAVGVLLLLVARRSVGTAAGLLALLFVMTREPILSYGMRAYLDLPFAALLLGALALELGEPRRGSPVLVLLLLAGLLRPEAWALSLAYLGWLAWSERRPPRPLLVVLAFAAPVLWGLTDLALTGDPLFSFTGTRAGVERLERPTGLGGLVTVAPFRVGEILRPDLLAGAAIGGLAVLLRGPATARRVLTGAVAFGVAFALLAAAGLPVLTRYLLPLGAIGCLLAAHALTGWRAERSIWLGRGWAALAASVLVLVVAFAPSQLRRLDRLQESLAAQQRTIDELRLLVASAPCGPIAVPNRRPVPLIALWTGERARDVVPTQVAGVPRSGTYVLPATRAAADDFVLDARDRERSIPPAPASWQLVGRTDRWTMVASCR